MVKVVKDFSCRSAKHCPNNSKCKCNSLLQWLYKPTDFFLPTEFQALILIRYTKGVGIDIPWTIQAVEEVEMVRSKDLVDQYSSVLVGSYYIQILSKCQNWHIKNVQWFVPLSILISRHALSVPLYFVLLALGSRQGNLTDVVVNADMWPRRGSNRQNYWQ